MKESLTAFFVMAMVFSISQAYAGTSVLERAKQDINPMVGGTEIEIPMVSASDSENPYLLRFALEFGKPLKADAFWTYANTDKLIRDGITIYNEVDGLGYVKLVTLDMRAVKEKTGSFTTSIELNLGYNNPISGYPHFRRVQIHENKNLSEDERHKCFEATCLEIVVLEWSKEKESFVEAYVTPHRPLNQ